MTIQRVWMLLILVVLIALGGSYFLYSFREVEHQLRVQKEQELAVKTAELAKIQIEINSLTDQKKELEESLNVKIENLNALVKEYSDTMKVRADKIDSLTDENATLKSEKEKLASALEGLKSKVRALEKEKEALYLEIQKLQRPVSSEETDAAAEATEDILPSESDPVKLGSIVVQKSGVQATIQNVNKVYGFVVMNAGSSEGLKKDSVVNIFRGQKIVAQAVVQQVRTHLSAAVLLPGSLKKEVRVGDQVSTL